MSGGIGSLGLGLILATLVVAALACDAEPGRDESAGRDGSDGKDGKNNVAALFQAAINADRAGLPFLDNDEVLTTVVQDYADELTRRHESPPGDVSQVLIERLNGSAYRPYRLVVGFAQMTGPFQQVLEAWRRGDPGTFERMKSPDLRNLALGLGKIDGQPFYLVVAAVRQSEHYAASSAGLRQDLEKLRKEMLGRVNEVRRSARARELRRHPSLDSIAQRYAEDMLSRGFYGHLSPEGQDVGDRAKAGHYAFCKVGENVASGQATVEKVVDGWVKSPEHYENLADRDFQEIGIGFAAGPSSDGGYRLLWVQVFGQPLDGCR